MALRMMGATYQQIADAMNTAGVATPGGGPQWYPSYAYRQLRTREAGFGADDFVALDRRRRAAPPIG
ncbi:hypothetical protein GCM10009839_34150 [Catenulispora yoronensis]|uniref:Recombinase domain-containing protein n=1 Tax=Catenulispora yoronensis TaxID=450799 RepID=A0ABP5FPI4_9ACTN